MFLMFWKENKMDKDKLKRDIRVLYDHAENTNLYIIKDGKSRGFIRAMKNYFLNCVDILIDAEEIPETNNKNNLLLELKNKIKEVKANEYENICVSLNTAKKLIEVGIEVESHFCWNSLPYMEQNDLKYTIKQFPAPTFEELDPIDHIEKDGKMYILRITKAVNHWLINYVNLRNPKDCLINRDNHHFTNEHSLCETMAEVMIQLKKEGLI